MTAEDIYYGISSKAVTREAGIKLIENYGIRQQQENIKKLQNDIGGYSKEIESVIERINLQLDKMLHQAMEICTHKEGL